MIRAESHPHIILVEQRHVQAVNTARLHFIDDSALRQNVQKALNQGRVLQQMRRAIYYVNSGKIRIETEAKQQIWNECSRLNANAIIYYNTLLLPPRPRAEGGGRRDLEAIQILQGISPLA